MKNSMRARFIPILIAVLAFACVAQDATQQPLPSAPSAAKYPPKPATPPASAAPPPAPAQTQAPAQTAAPQSSAPAPADTSATPASNLGTLGTAGQQPSKSDDQEEKLTTIVKLVDEVNVVFNVTDKRGKFVNDLK